MVLEKSAGAIIFRKESGKPLFLLLHYPTSPRNTGEEDKSSSSPTESRLRDESGKEREVLFDFAAARVKKEYWGLPKGHIEKKEKLEETAKREVEEEAGLKDIKFIDGFKEQEKYFFTKNRKKIFKTATYLLAETKTKEIKTSLEHLGFKWLPYEEALKQLTFKNAREILTKAHNFVSEKGSQRE